MLNDKSVHMVIATFSAFLSVVAIVIIETLPVEEKKDQWIMNHVCLIQIFGSMFLFLGALNHNKWFYLPWLISALIFTYTLVYKSLQFWLLVSTNVKTFLPLNILLYSVVGFWLYYMVEVWKDFQHT